MTDEIDFAGKQYVSSRRAAHMSGYTQDYIGQLARAGHIEAQRIGGLWYVSYDSLDSYKTKAGEYVPQSPLAPTAQHDDLGSFVALDGKDYISSSRASDLSGYTQDYIGQLARGGQLMARQVGNRWYVERGSLLSHKNEKDSLLAAVQAESVGLGTRTHLTDGDRHKADLNLMTYITENAALKADMEHDDREDRPENAPSGERQTRIVPIRVVRNPISIKYADIPAQKQAAERPRRTAAPMVGMLGAVATIVVLVTFGFASIRSKSSYTTNIIPHASSMAALASEAVESAGDILERWLAPEISYRRAD